MENKFDSTLLSGLNEEQREAVTAPLRGSILVLAGAGCGKTTVLARRIGWLCSNGIPPGRICALTFTRMAAEEMRIRVGKIDSVRDGIGEPSVTTFHSFSLTILKDIVGKNDNFSKLGYSTPPRLQSDRERLRLLFELTSDEERKYLKVDLTELDSLLSRYNVFPERVECLSLEYVKCIVEIAKRINLKKKTLGLWGFDDLTPAVIALFEKHRTIQDHYRGKFDYFLVDEFQDTNPVQIQMLKSLLSENAGLFAVGDDDQAIYGFRGADIRPTVEFCTIFPNAQRIKLQVNYRSVPSILAVANKIFKNKPLAYRKILKSGLYGNIVGQKPRKLHFEDQVAMVDWILKKTSEFSKKNSIPISQCVLLFRINKTREWVEEDIKAKGIAESKMPQLLTVHASKGLEFPIVFLCDLEDGVFPNYRILHGTHQKGLASRVMKLVGCSKRCLECDWDEEQRLFYVGVTRAKQELYLISVKNKQIFGRKRKFRKSRLLKLI